MLLLLNIYYFILPSLESKEHYREVENSILLVPIILPFPLPFIQEIIIITLCFFLDSKRVLHYYYYSTVVIFLELTRDKYN